MDGIPKESALILHSRPEVSLASIRRLWGTTMRSRGRKVPVKFDGTARELEFYLGGAYLDVTHHLEEIERQLKSCSLKQGDKQRMVQMVEEVSRELQLCADVGSFALSMGRLKD